MQKILLCLAVVLMLAGGGCVAHRAREAVTAARLAVAVAVPEGATVARVWTGRVEADRADEYQKYLDAEGVKKLPQIKNNLGVAMFRREAVNGEVEFMVISYWPSMDAIKAYTGEDIDKPRDLPRDAEFLVPPGGSVEHFKVYDALK